MKARRRLAPLAAVAHAADVPGVRARLLDLLFPLACVVCLQPVRGGPAALGPLCDACRATAIAPSPPLCLRCGVPLPTPPALTGGEACGACRAFPPRFATARGAALYHPAGTAVPFVTAIQAFKYRGARTLARPLAALITGRLSIPPAVVVVPVPLHPARLRERRYNQAALLARAIGEQAARPVVLRALARRLATPPQAGLNAPARRANLIDAFVVARPEAIAHRHVLVIDDIITTGATADACARALLAAGARRVDVYAIGRTPLGPHA